MTKKDGKKQTFSTSSQSYMYMKYCTPYTIMFLVYIPGILHNLREHFASNNCKKLILGLRNLATMPLCDTCL